MSGSIKARKEYYELTTLKINPPNGGVVVVGKQAARFSGQKNWRLGCCQCCSLGRATPKLGAAVAAAL